MSMYEMEEYDDVPSLGERKPRGPHADVCVDGKYAKLLGDLVAGDTVELRFKGVIVESESRGKDGKTLMHLSVDISDLKKLSSNSEFEALSEDD